MFVLGQQASVLIFINSPSIVDTKAKTFVQLLPLSLSPRIILLLLIRRSLLLLDFNFMSNSEPIFKWQASIDRVFINAIEVDLPAHQLRSLGVPPIVRVHGLFYMREHCPARLVR